MRQIRWDPDHEVYIAQIDAEHRDLFQVAGAFEQAIERHAPPTEIHGQLQALVTHLEEHLSHEEWLMQSVAYPSYGWHKQQHETARRRLKLFVPLIESGDAEAADVFLDFLAGWLQDHTSVTDRMMAAYVRNYERAHAGKALERWGTAVARATAAKTREASPDHAPFPKTIRLCRTCGEQTTHELRPTGLACLKCAEHSVRAELDRD